MEETSKDYSPSSPMRWVGNGTGLGEVDERSETNKTTNCAIGGVEGGEIMHEVSLGTSPQVREKIEKASPKTARNVALRMYESMKRHGLREEAGKALFEIEEMEEEKDDESGVMMRKKNKEEEKNSEELLGMDYLMKDGFVSYLRDMARITPPIPQQVNFFLYIYESFLAVQIFFGITRTRVDSVWIKSIMLISSSFELVQYCLIITLRV